MPDLNLNASFPGEAIIVALLNYAAQRSHDMDEGLRKRLDAVLVQQVEDLQGVWRALWIKAGVVKP